MRGEGGGEDGGGDDDERGDGAERDEGIAQDAAKLASQSHVTDGDGRRAEHPVHPGFHVRRLGASLGPVKSAPIARAQEASRVVLAEMPGTLATRRRRGLECAT